MGRASSIDEATGKRLIDALGRLGSIRKAAAECGVSKDAASRYFATVKQASAPAVVLPEQPPEPEVVRPQSLANVAHASLWDSKTALEANYQRITRLADQLDAGIIEENGEFSTTTPVATNVKAIKEIREHVKTSMDLLRLLIDVDEVRKFQDAVIEAIGEADEPTKHRILAKLRERRALGSTLFRAGH